MFPSANFVCVPPTAQCTCEACVGSELERKLVPVNVMLSGAVAPITTALGLILASVGTRLGSGLMQKATGLERPLFPAPVAGFRVMTVATPGLAISAAGTSAISFMIFPPLPRVGVVLRVVPFHCTTVFVTKPWPFTVRVKVQGVAGVG